MIEIKNNISNNIESKKEINNNMSLKKLNTIEKELKKKSLFSRIGSITEFCLEFYKIVIGTCLIMFIPQKCVNKQCDLLQNVFKNSYIYNIAFIFNIITLISFVLLYIVEINRENILITHLDYNKYISNDHESVGKILQLLDINIKNKLLRIDLIYLYNGYISLILYIINIIISGIPIYKNNLGLQTIIPFISYILFISIKLYNVWFIMNTETNIFYSAYIKHFIQFNDINLLKSIEQLEEGIQIDNELYIKIQNIKK